MHARTVSEGAIPLTMSRDMFAAKNKKYGQNQNLENQYFYFPVSEPLEQLLTGLNGRQSLRRQNTKLGRTKTPRLFWAVWEDIECISMQA